MAFPGHIPPFHCVGGGGLQKTQKKMGRGDDRKTDTRDSRRGENITLDVEISFTAVSCFPL